ncbi:MAG: tetratricopeptide repeat protein [Ignavibacteria bacterium]|nr:tetratricopeptide repeat protein [Ignavibacteria bacterium]
MKQSKTSPNFFDLAEDSANKAGVLNNIAMCYEKKGDKINEEKYFLQAISYDPKSVNAMNGIAAFYLRQGDKEKASMYFRKILDLNPEDAVAKSKLDSLNSVR